LPRYRVKLSDVDLLGDLDRGIDLNAEIANGALDFRMPKQKLNCSKIAGPPIDLGDLRSSWRVGAELGRVEPDTRHPLLHEPRILPRRLPTSIAATGEEEVARPASDQSQVRVDLLVASGRPPPTGRACPSSSGG